MNVLTNLCVFFWIFNIIYSTNLVQSIMLAIGKKNLLIFMGRSIVSNLDGLNETKMEILAMYMLHFLPKVKRSWKHL